MSNQLLAQTIDEIKELRDKRRVEANRYVNAEVEKYNHGFAAAYEFDVDKFMENMIDSIDNLSAMSLAHIALPENMGTIAEVKHDEIVVGITKEFLPEIPLTRKPVSAESLITVMSEMYYNARVPPPFPVLDFNYTAYNRPVVSDSTNIIYKQLVWAGVIFVDPIISLQTYLERMSVLYETTLPHRQPCARIKTTESRRRCYLYTSYSEMDELGGLSCGFVFNPYRISAQSSIIKLEKRKKNYNISYLNNYRQYEVKYPVGKVKDRPGVYTYSLEEWSSWLNLRIRDLHPRWYMYDFVATFKINMPSALYMLISPEFITPLLIDGDQEVPWMACQTLPVMTDEKYKRDCKVNYMSSICLYSQSNHKYYNFHRVRVRMLELLVIRMTETKVVLCPTISGKPQEKQSLEIDLMNGLPKERYYYKRGERYYYASDLKFCEYDGEEKILYHTNTVFYREYASAFDSYVDNVLVMNITDGGMVYSSSDKVLPELRDFGIEYDINTTHQLPSYDRIDQYPVEANVGILRLQDSESKNQRQFRVVLDI